MTEAAKCPVCDWEIGEGAVDAGGVTVCCEDCARAETLLAVIRRMYDAFARKDVEGLIANLDPAIVWQVADSSPLADGSPYRSIDSVRQVFERIFAVFDFVIEADEMFVAGHRVVMLGYYDGTLRSGPRFRAQVAHVWTLADGRITRFQQYLDTLRVAQALR